jgi:hypothetical protein
VPGRADDKPQPKPPTRELLFPANAEDTPASLRPFVAKLLAADQAPVDAADVKPSGVFARVVTRKYVLENGALKKGGTLGTRPFIFATLPEALYGRSLLQVFSAIGYSADQVLTGELGEEKVVVVFRWEEKITIHPGRDGNLPETWQTCVCPATWDNIFSLVDNMANDKDWNYVREETKPPVLTKLQLRSPKEGQFLLGFPDAGKHRIKSSTYYSLRDAKGADWEYRQFLDRSMGVAEHFTGDGTSKPTITGSGKPPVGFPEFVGPNREVTALPEVAVVGLGALRVTDK